VGGRCSGRKIWLFSESRVYSGDGGHLFFHSKTPLPLDKRHLAIELKTSNRYIILGSRRQPEVLFMGLPFSWKWKFHGGSPFTWNPDRGTCFFSFLNYEAGKNMLIFNGMIIRKKVIINLVGQNYEGP